MKTTGAILLGALALFLLEPAPALSQVYKWVDKQGRVHYTDNPDQLPEPQRTRVLNELEEKLRKERQRREELKRQGIDVPDERLPPPPPPPRPRNSGVHPSAGRLKQQQAAREQWSQKAQRARERVESLESKCAELKETRDRHSQDRLTMARPGAGQRYQESLAAYEKCEKNLEEARHYLEVELPEQARKAGIPPGWIR